MVVDLRAQRAIKEVSQRKIIVFMENQMKLLKPGTLKLILEQMVELIGNSIIRIMVIQSIILCRITTKSGGAMKGIQSSVRPLREQKSSEEAIMKEYDNNFLDADDFIDCIGRGGELEFLYRDVPYALIHHEGRVLVGEVGNEDSIALYPDASQALDYPIQGKRLSDILQHMQITFRSL